jgi:hypothetical protein
MPLIETLTVSARITTSLSQRLDAIDQSPNSLSQCPNTLEQNLNNLSLRLRLDTINENLGWRLNRLNRRIDNLGSCCIIL